MNYKNLFEELLPDELDLINEILSVIIQDVKNSKFTNLKYQSKCKSIKCPKCFSKNIVKMDLKIILKDINVKTVISSFLYQQALLLLEYD